MTANMLRPVGNVERMSTVRHHQGTYRCVANTARYSASGSAEELPAIIEDALSEVILQHPAMCSGIVNEDKNDPSFVLLKSVDVSRCIEYRKLNATTLEEHDKGLINVLEQQHSELWPDVKSLPPWKLIIVQSEAFPGEPSFDAVYAFHHALADGLSGFVFHRSFLEALNNPKKIKKAVNHILPIPESTTLSPPLEECIKFKISWLFLLRAVWTEFRPRWLFPDPSPAPWTSLPCSAARIENYQSRVKILSIAPELVTTILAACREQKSTLTGLLHGLIVTSLTSHVPDAGSFKSATPYSLRQQAGLSPTHDMGVHVSTELSTYTSDNVTSIRSASTPEQTTSLIWTIARNFRASIAAELARVPYDNPVGLLTYVSDMHEMFRGRLSRARAETYEVSNVGSLKSAEREGKWTIQRSVFTQSGLGTGPAFAVNVASVAGGPLIITVTWLQGDIEETLVDTVLKDLNFGLKCIGTGKEVSLSR